LIEKLKKPGKVLKKSHKKLIRGRITENMEESDKSTCIGGCGVVKNSKNIYLSAEKLDEIFRELIGIEVFALFTKFCFDFL
jgi:hypothetical protein